MMIRIGNMIPKTRAEGPGTRFAIWVQGCDQNCPGCFAQHLRSHDGGTLMPVSEVLEAIKAVRSDISGVTFLGGEPFLQARALLQIADAAHAMDLSVLCFSGYTLADLVLGGDPDHLALLLAIDLLVDGPYLEEQRSFSRPLVGSDNQQFRYLTQRITPAQIAEYHNRIECRIGRDGVLCLNGMGDFPAVMREFGCTSSKKEAIPYA